MPPAHLLLPPRPPCYRRSMEAWMRNVRPHPENHRLHPPDDCRYRLHLRFAWLRERAARGPHLSLGWLPQAWCQCSRCHLACRLTVPLCSAACRPACPRHCCRLACRLAVPVFPAACRPAYLLAYSRHPLQRCRSRPACPASRPHCCCLSCFRRGALLAYPLRGALCQRQSRCPRCCRLASSARELGQG